MSRDAFNTYEATETTKLTTQPHALVGLGLAVHVPSTVWSGTISSAPVFPADGTGVGQLSVTTVTGALTSILPGQTVIINGVYYTYCRKASSGTTLYIDGLGASTVTTSIGTGVSAISEFMPWPRRHRYNAATWYANFDEAYVAQNSNFGPQAVFGCAAVRYKDGSVTFNFDGTRSQAWTPASTITAYLWTFPDATTVATSTATWATSTAYKNGAYVSLKVTDSNGDTHTGYRLLFKFDSSNKPKTDFEVLSLSGEWGDGWTLQIRSTDSIFEQQNTSTNYYTARNHVVLFGHTYYGSTQQDIGGNFPNRQNVWLEGWVTETETEQWHDGYRYVYTIQTVDALLKELYTFPVALDDAGAPATWLEFADPTLDLAALHLCRWRSTVLDVVDVTFAATAGSTAVKKYVDTAGATIWEQFQQLYNWLIGGTCSVDAQSGIYFEQDAIITDTVSSLPQMVELFGAGGNPALLLARDGALLVDIPLYVKPVAKFTAYGVDYATPVGSRSPDDPVLHGGGIEEISAGLLGSQAQLNIWAGNKQAQLNNIARGRTYPTVGIVRIDPTPQSTVSIDGASFNFVVRGCEIEFDTDNGMAYTTLHLEKDVTTNIAGTTIVFTVL